MKQVSEEEENLSRRLEKALMICTRRAQFRDLWKLHLAETLLKINNTPPPPYTYADE
jgi:hypothetical protein